MHFGNISSDPEVCFFMTRHLTHFQICFYFPSGLVLACVCVFACGCVVYMHTCVGENQPPHAHGGLVS